MGGDRNPEAALVSVTAMTAGTPEVHLQVSSRHPSHGKSRWETENQGFDDAENR